VTDDEVFKPVERVSSALRTGNIWIWILKLLTEENKYAYQLREEINDRFNFEPATVTAYAVLYRLEKSEFVKEASNEIFPNRKYYEITEKGVEALRQARRLLERTIIEIYEDMPLDEESTE
jgi:DNA-binding PadR family transcriptional regulator